MTKCVRYTRNKPIMMDIPSNSGFFLFNGHPSFTKARSDNPKIGTVEDWNIFSFLGSHPIHIHLINFQVVAKAKLKQHSSGCYYAELDYWANPERHNYQGKSLFNCTKKCTDSSCTDCSNWTALCAKIYQLNFRDEAITNITNQRYLEDEVNADGKTFGFNITQQINNQSKDDDPYKNSKDCYNKDYKYLCGPLTS